MKLEHPFIVKMEEIKKTVSEIKSILLKGSNSNLLYISNDFNKLMGISDSTAKTWRKEGKIGYSIIGNKIFYTVSDINEMLQNHYRPVKKKE